MPANFTENTECNISLSCNRRAVPYRRTRGGNKAFSCFLRLSCEHDCKPIVAQLIKLSPILRTCGMHHGATELSLVHRILNHSNSAQNSPSNFTMLTRPVTENDP
jgi:hypothetical protein